MVSTFLPLCLLGFFKTLKDTKLRSSWSGLAEIQTHPIFYGCPPYLQDEDDLIKHEVARVVTTNPHYSPMGAICCHGNQSSELIWPITYYSLSPNPLMLQIKFDCKWPTGLRDIACLKVLTLRQTDRQTDNGSSPIL